MIDNLYARSSLNSLPLFKGFFRGEHLMEFINDHCSSGITWLHSRFTRLQEIRYQSNIGNIITIDVFIKYTVWFDFRTSGAGKGMATATWKLSRLKSRNLRKYWNYHRDPAEYSAGHYWTSFAERHIAPGFPTLSSMCLICLRKIWMKIL